MSKRCWLNAKQCRPWSDTAPVCPGLSVQNLRFIIFKACYVIALKTVLCVVLKNHLRRDMPMPHPLPWYHAYMLYWPIIFNISTHMYRITNRMLVMKVGLLTKYCKNQKIVIEPSYEIMALFIFRKLILQMRMCGDLVGLLSDFRSEPSPTSILHVCEQRRLWRVCWMPRLAWAFADPYVISTIISWAGWIILKFEQ